MGDRTLKTDEERRVWIDEFARRLADHGDPPGLNARGAAAFAWDAVKRHKEHLGEDDLPEPNRLNKSTHAE